MAFKFLRKILTKKGSKDGMTSSSHTDKTASEKADNSLVVAAIDFGTTYSGWAFSFRHEFVKDPTKVSAKNWTGGQLVSHKGPTCALIKSDGKTLQSFGFEAELQYADLIAEEKHKEYYFFRRFKMLLFDKQELGRNVMIEDEGGKTLSAKTVISLSIRYLKDDLTQISENRVAGDGLQDKDIYWVLTVPAIWNDAAKQFMREAAQDAGIHDNKLTIALEPEAASLYCRYLPVEKCGKDKTSLASFGPGKRYLVLDAGGGTVDITVHEVMEGGHLKELHKASGGAWGGTKVDDAFMTFLSDIAGPLVMSRFKSESVEDYIDIFRDFELKKREIKPPGPDKDALVTFRVPTSFTDLLTEVRKQTLQEAVEQSCYASKIVLFKDKLRMDPNVARSFFELSIKSIINHVHGLLEESVDRGVEAILMVGGFSESPLLQEAIKNAFPGLSVIVPDEAGLAVLKGAVIFGHSPADTISERVSKFTYGTDASVLFDPDIHPINRKVVINERSKPICDDVFSTLVKAGQTLVVGEAQGHKIYTTLTEDQTSMDMDIYATQEQNPRFIDDIGCSKIGKFSIPVSGEGIGRKVAVRMIFGGTEINVECKEIATKKVHHLKVDFLS